MRILDLLRTSSSSLWKRKIRTVLTILGVVIGTASIVVMISLGLGLNKSTLERIEEYGGLTCAMVAKQMGRAYRELAENDPILVIYHQSIDALDKRVKRGKLDREIADLAKALAKDLRSAAIADPEYANGDYPKDIQPDALIAAVVEQY